MTNPAPLSQDEYAAALVVDRLRRQVRPSSSDNHTDVRKSSFFVQTCAVLATGASNRPERS